MNQTISIPFLPLNYINIKLCSSHIILDTHRSQRRSIASTAAYRGYSGNTVFISLFTSRIKVNPYNNEDRRHRIIDGSIVVRQMGDGTYRYLNGQQVSDETISALSRDNMIYKLRINGIISSILDTYTNGRTTNANAIPNEADMWTAVTRYANNLHEQAERQATERTENNEDVMTNLIRSYHSCTSDIRFKHTEKDDPENTNNNRYFGIELETECANSSAATSSRANLLATRVHRLMNNSDYNSLIKMETDGSLQNRGIEFITQPMTMSYIINNKDLFKQFLRTIDNTGYSSHDNGRCGMHIHVSRSQIPDDVLNKIYYIFESFKNEIIAFSRRTENGMRWCHFITDNNSSDTMDFEYISDHKGYSHGVAINNSNRHTVEFRIFRGTTNDKTFFANIQLIDNIINIAKTRETLEGLKWNDIINYETTYEELIYTNNKRRIYSTYEITDRINRIEVINRPVILVRPFQMNLEGDR